MTQVYDRDGKPIDATIVPDGGSVKVSFLMMDGAPADVVAITRAAMTGSLDLARHRPGTLTIDGIKGEIAATEREVLRNHRLSALSYAWRDPVPLEAAKPTATTADAAATADARYDARCADLERAWRGAA